jgi:colanic acid biosynthesis glycosyl transferase WcaI
MKIVCWSPNYTPEYMGIPPLVTDCAQWLSRRGHEVDVVTALPNYPQRVISTEYRGVIWRTETLHGVRVRRSWLRVRPNEGFIDKGLYELSFTAMSTPNVLRSLAGTDVIICVVPSLLAAVVASALRRVFRRKRLIIWVQDLVLLAAESLGEAGRVRRAVLRWLGRLESWAYRNADAVVVCSPGFAEFVDADGRCARVETVLNWVDPDEYAPGETPSQERLRVIYAGNIGYTQGLESLVDAAALLGPGVDVEIVGDGNAASSLKRRAERTPNVSVVPAVPRAEASALLRSADVLVLVQREISAGVNFPSKIGPYLASGRPVVASLDLDTPAARLLEESGGALLVGPGDVDGLAEAIRRLVHQPELRQELGERGRAFAVARLSSSALLPRFEELLAEMTA